MTFVNFKSLVAAYLNRKVTDFTVNGVDVIGDAVNDAKRVAQREHDFVKNRAIGFVTLSKSGTEISTFKATPGGSALSVKKLLSVWLYDTTGGVYTRTAMMEPLASSELGYMLPGSVVSEAFTSFSTSARYFYQVGTKLYCTGVDTLDVMCEVVIKQPDYALDADEDFFLTDYKDWMLLKTVEQLNFFLKEDQRVQISQGAMAARWDSVMKQENNLVLDYNNSLD
jgi:hypothetical protein